MSQDQSLLPAPSHSEAPSRRSFLRAASMAPAVAVASTGALAANLAHPDAELIELGREFDRFRHRYDVARVRWVPAWDEHKRLCDLWAKEHPRHTHNE
jgi:hypothetical protein